MRFVHTRRNCTPASIFVVSTQPISGFDGKVRLRRGLGAPCSLAGFLGRGWAELKSSPGGLSNVVRSLDPSPSILCV